MRICTVIWLILSLFLNKELQGQTPYQGGESDGHSMIEFEMPEISSTVNDRTIDIHPSILRSGDIVHLPSEIYVKEIYLVSVNGLVQHTLHTGYDAKSVQINIASSGMYILHLQGHDGQLYHAKLLLLKD